MRPFTLLSNGTYHVDVDGDGCGRSRHGSVALTRWREDRQGDGGGIHLYLRDAESRDVWSATRRPLSDRTTADTIRFDAVSATFMRAHGDLETRLTLAVDAEQAFELRRLEILNRSTRRRTIGVTSCAELVLAPAATDAAHLAFSKLFVETAIDRTLRAVLATRRPSSAEEPRGWLFHTAVAAAGSGSAADLSFETDRMAFLGRGRDDRHPRALGGDGPLGGHEGPVLDAIAALRLPLVLDSGAACTLDFFTGYGTTRDSCEALARKVHERGAGERVLARKDDYRAATLARLGLTVDEGRAFERLAAAILVADPACRGKPEEIAANRRGQSGLWGFGISGDLPLVVVRLAADDGPELVTRMARAHACWRAFGVQTEMAMIGPGAAATPERQRAWLDALRASPAADMLDKPGGVFLRTDRLLDEGDRHLLAAAARVVIDRTTRLDEAGTDGAGRASSASPSRTASSASASDSAPASASRRGSAPDEPTTWDDSEDHAPIAGLVFENGFGGFSEALDEYVVTTTAETPTPAPWINVIANACFGTLVSESGSASTWSENSHEFRLTPWSNDPVADPNTEAFYVRDDASGTIWSPTLQPTRGRGTYTARHGFGCSRFEHVEHGIDSSLAIFVAADAPLKFSALTLRNRSGRARRLSVTGYIEWVLGDERAKTAMHVVTELDAATGALFARNRYNTDFADRIAFFDVDREGFGPVEASGDRADFIGPDGSLAQPAAVVAGRLGGEVGAALDPCAALRVAFDLEAGAERTVVFRLGAGRSVEEVVERVRLWRGAETAARELAVVRAYWQARLGAVAVRTPDKAVNALANGWLVYQLIVSRLWGRTAFYQSSGAFGFRDQLQDVLALVHAAPELTREHLLLAASRQFVEGDVQHWWHPPVGKGIRTRCSDDYLWLPFVLARYVEATGDRAVLDETVGFLASAPLADGELSRYEQPAAAAESASLYEHAVRALRHGMRYGARGLPLMGTGDWNDGMNLVGAGGRGESVWLAFFLIAALRGFSPLAHERGDNAFAAQCEAEAVRLAANLEANGWDGAWYRRAWFDDGSVLGSAASRECRIDSIAQSWSVLSGAAPPERAVRAMESVHEHLVRARERLVLLLTPPFDTSTPSPGYIQGYVPGVRENGGQYTHAAVWAAMAYAALGDGKRAWALFALLDPIGHGDSAERVATYKVEPYVVAGDVYAAPPHVGRGGWTWYTGSAGWMYQLLVGSLLGVRRQGQRLFVEPLLPRNWPGFELTYRHAASSYRIRCRRGAAGEAAGVRIDGAASADGSIALVDDGRAVEVEIVLKQDGNPRH